VRLQVSDGSDIKEHSNTPIRDRRAEAMAGWVKGGRWAAQAVRKPPTVFLPSGGVRGLSPKAPTKRRLGASRFVRASILWTIKVRTIRSGRGIETNIRGEPGVATISPWFNSPGYASEELFAERPWSLLAR
jgi:hypothetical protein